MNNKTLILITAGAVGAFILLKALPVFLTVLEAPLTWFIALVVSSFLLFVRVSRLRELEEQRRLRSTKPVVVKEDKPKEEPVEPTKPTPPEEPVSSFEELTELTKRVVFRKGSVVKKYKPEDKPLIRELPEEEFLRRLELLKERVLGQEQAIEKVIKGLKSLYYGTRLRERKPLVFLFLGTAGTGKTETAKQIAELFFEGRLLFLPMNQYADVHTSSSLFGSPKGYVGSDKGGDLTQGVKTKLKGSGVILLDEIEKADVRLWQHFLQGFDEGKLKDISFDEWVDVSRCVFVLTSNLASDRAEWLKGRSDQELRNIIASALPPELGQAFVSRIDYIAVYGHLPEEVLRKLVHRKLRKALERLNLVVENEDALVHEITQVAMSRSVREIDVLIEEVLIDLMEGRS